MLSQRPWRAECVIQMIGLIMATLFGAIILAGVLQQAEFPGFKSQTSFGGVLLVTLAGQGAIWIFILIFLKQHSVTWREAFGLGEPALKRALGLALLVFVIVLPVLLALQMFSTMGMDAIGWKPEKQGAVNFFIHAKSPLKLGYLILFTVVIVPVAEEFVFRGMLYPFVKQLGRPRLALFGVSALFAGIHFNAPTFVPLFVFALALTWLYEKTNCLLAPVTAHAAFNAANIALFFLSEEFSRTLPAQQ